MGRTMFVNGEEVEVAKVLAATHAAVFAASFAATIQHYRWTSVELTDRVYDLAHEQAVETADGAVRAMARAEQKEASDV